MIARLRLIGGALALLASLVAGGAGAQAPAAPPAAAPQTWEGPAFVLFHVEAKADATEKLVSLLKRYRAAARKQAANRGVQLIQELGRPNRLAVLESWNDQPAFEAHEKGPLAELRQEIEPLALAPPDRRLHHDFLVETGRPAGKGAIYAVTHIDVNPPNRVATDAILKQLVPQARKDAGNISYNIYYQNLANLNHYDSVSVWRDRKAFEAYERTAETRQARTALTPLLGALYDERLYRVVE